MEYISFLLLTVSVHFHTMVSTLQVATTGKVTQRTVDEISPTQETLRTEPVTTFDHYTGRDQQDDVTNRYNSEMTSGTDAGTRPANRDLVITRLSGFTPSLPTSVTFDTKPHGDADVITCDPVDHWMCDVTGMARCVVGPRGLQCVCLAGYARDQRGVCVETVHYGANLIVDVVYMSHMSDNASEEERKMTKHATESLTHAVLASELSTVFLNVNVTGFSRTGHNTLSVDFEIILPRKQYMPPQTIKSHLAEGLLSISRTQPLGDNKTFVIGSTDIRLMLSSLQLLNFTVLGPCTYESLNYCHMDATCQQLINSGGFTCSCNHGYTDVSIDKTNAPGENCSKMCHCLNGGFCVSNIANNETVCSCSSWQLGDVCDLDGKLLFIALCAVIGCCILVTLAVCLACLRRLKRHKARDKYGLDGMVNRDFPGVATQSSPKLWIENWQMDETRTHFENWTDT